MKTLKRRKTEGKTDYKNRIGLLKSGKPRIVVRKTNKYLIVQYIESEEAKDKVILGVSSKDLLKHGWPKKSEGSLKSVPAGHLVGLLIGKKIVEKKLATPIIDLGLARSIAGGRLYSVLKGLVDSGIKIKCDEKVFPSEERLSGKHLKEDVQKAYAEVKIKLK